ncbi:MAG TPA: redoxin domain-containing protein [Bacteroidia bacterium]|nr:redoxin domain-containing protein [Bacteroidia bacterium]
MDMKTGEKAPDFKLFNTQKKEVSLSDLRGKNVLLLFYPFAFSGTCTTELCSIRDSFSIYNSANAEVFGISCDSVFTQIRFKDEQKLNFELLSDWNKEASRSYGSLYDSFVFGTKGVSKRSAFVIDKEGIIRYAEVLETAGDQPNYKAIQDCLASLK